MERNCDKVGVAGFSAQSITSGVGVNVAQAVFADIFERGGKNLIDLNSWGNGWIKHPLLIQRFKKNKNLRGFGLQYSYD